MRARSMAVAALIWAGLLVGCGGKGPVDVALEYRPTDLAGAYNGAALVSPVYVEVQDKRLMKDDIGKNIEGSIPIRVFTADDPAAFVKQVMVERLRAAGTTVTEDRKEAKRSIVATLDKFWCNESDKYRTQVETTVQVLGAAGEPLSKGVVSGANTRFGRSRSDENYQESFSDATLDMVEHLLSSVDFRNAMAAK
jgi:hypothetical protein